MFVKRKLEIEQIILSEKTWKKNLGKEKKNMKNQKHDTENSLKHI